MESQDEKYNSYENVDYCRSDIEKYVAKKNKKQIKLRS